jgi:peroxidase
MNAKGKTFVIMTVVLSTLLSSCGSGLQANLQSSGAAPVLNTYAPIPSLVDESSQSESQQTERSEAGIEPLDGRGNNVAHPDWGNVDQQFLRFSKADYADGISSPAGTNRPSARTVSNRFSVSPEDGITNDRDLTAFVYAWGQFLDHGMILTRQTESEETFPIVVPTGDPWFDPSGTGTVKILFSRSIYDIGTGTSVDNPRQQINTITAFIDGSQIYGVDAERAAALRTFVGGRMKTSAGNLLSFNTGGFVNDNDAHRVPDDELFLAGDVRANENPELLSMQILFIREHNRIAAQAAREHPDWTDEELYQHARRIVIAELQKITYEEFLPAILGPNAIPAYQGYRADVNPGIATEFSTAAFRLGHSMLGDDIEFLDNQGNEIREAIALRDSFFNPSVVQETGIDPILKYLASDNAQEIDTIVVDDVRNFLFGKPGQGGFDLAAMNIQRGRDHGLADYNTVREAYGLTRITSFDQITSDPGIQSALAATYGSVDNIDLWIGGLAEDHLPNSSLGATFTHILVDQFTRLRDGDRFWYQAALPRNMLRDVQNTSLAEVIRHNTELTKLQENVFFFNDETVIVDAPPEDPQRAGRRNNALQDNQVQPAQDGRRQPPQGAFDACLNLTEDTACTFIGRNNELVGGTCQTIPGSELACAPLGGPPPRKP